MAKTSFERRPLSIIPMLQYSLPSHFNRVWQNFEDCPCLNLANFKHKQGIRRQQTSPPVFNLQSVFLFFIVKKNLVENLAVTLFAFGRHFRIHITLHTTIMSSWHDVIHETGSTWRIATSNYVNNNNNNNIRLISQDKPLDHNASYIYTSVSQDR